MFPAPVTVSSGAPFSPPSLCTSIQSCCLGEGEAGCFVKTPDPRPLKSLCGGMLFWGKSHLCVFLIPGYNLCRSPPAPLTATALRISGFSFSTYNSGHHRALSRVEGFSSLPSQRGLAGAVGFQAPTGSVPRLGWGVRSSRPRRWRVLTAPSPRASRGQRGHLLGDAPVPPLDLPGGVGGERRPSPHCGE